MRTFVREGAQAFSRETGREWQSWEILERWDLESDVICPKKGPEHNTKGGDKQLWQVSSYLQGKTEKDLSDRQTTGPRFRKCPDSEQLFWLSCWAWGIIKGFHHVMWRSNRRRHAAGKHVMSSEYEGAREQNIENGTDQGCGGLGGVLHVPSFVLVTATPKPALLHGQEPRGAGVRYFLCPVSRALSTILNPRGHSVQSCACGPQPVSALQRSTCVRCPSCGCTGSHVSVLSRPADAPWRWGAADTQDHLSTSEEWMFVDVAFWPLAGQL